MDGNTLVAIGSVMVALLTAVAAAVMTYVRFKHTAQQELDREKVSRHERLIDRQEAQIKRMEEGQKQMQQTIMTMLDENASCHAERAEDRVWMQRFRDLAVSQVVMLRKAGHEVEDVPPLPPRKADSTPALEYAARSTEMNRRLSNELRPPDPLCKRRPDPDPDPNPDPNPDATEGGQI